MYATSRVTLGAFLQQAGACSQHMSRGASHTPFTSSQAVQTNKFCHKLCPHSKHSHRQIQTQCAAPNTQSIGRRVVGSVATAAFLTWALRSASAKSMKPGEVQKRSRDEENAAFENREGEVTICLTALHAFTQALANCKLLTHDATKPSLAFLLFILAVTKHVCCRCITQMLNGSLCSVQASTECYGDQAQSYH